MYVIIAVVIVVMMPDALWQSGFLTMITNSLTKAVIIPLYENNYVCTMFAIS